MDFGGAGSYNCVYRLLVLAIFALFRPLPLRYESLSAWIESNLERVFG